MYSVVFKRSAEKDLTNVHAQYYPAVVKHIQALALEPRPPGCVKLTGSANLYRLRVGVYRIIYSICDNVLTVEIIKIAHRSSAYK